MDRITQTLIRYEWKALTRNRFQLCLLAIMFAFGMYALYYGQSEINTQREVIEAVQKLETDEFSQYRGSFTEEMETLEQERAHDIASKPAYAWYRHGYHAILPPHDYASLAIGQRDLFRYYYRLTGMSLHYQLFENELANPVNLMAGNFDLSFVLVYLLPLLIIAFCYGLFSVEKENGTLALLQIQTVSIRNIIQVRLGFYFVLIVGLAVFISFVGLCISANPFSAQNIVPATAWLFATILYCAFWFGMLFLIISFKKSAAFSAISAVGFWLLFLIIVPSVLNMIVTIKYPLNSTTLAGLTRRTGLENENDEQEMERIIMEFFDHKPELAGSKSLIKNNRLPKAYAAFTSLKDVHNQQLVDNYNAQVVNRNRWASSYFWLSPAVVMQELLAKITQTDLHTFLRFQDDLVGFHRQITDFYFTRLFWDKPISLEDYAKLPVFESSAENEYHMNVWREMGIISLSTVLVFLGGYIGMSRSERM